jgi:methyl-accepting chemotaxis protein
MGWVLFEVVAAVALTIGAVLLPVVAEVREGEERGAIDFKAAAALSSLHSGVWIAGLIALVLVALHSIKTSHRIAGPLYRFRAVYRALAEGGSPSSVMLRRGDLLHEDAAALNDALAEIRRRAEESRRARELLLELRPSATAETARRIDSILEGSRATDAAS